MEDPVREGAGSTPNWKGRWMEIEIRDPVKEHEGSKDSYVSYCVKTRVSWVCDLEVTDILERG